MIKAFISHSSAQKDFVRKLGEEIGPDNCIVDEKNFESGQLILDEIIKAIKKSGIFVFLISNEALESEWVKTELSKIRDLIDNKAFSDFLPFIIDSKIKHDDARIKPWIKNDYILEKYDSPILLARKIKERIRQIIWKDYPFLEKKDNLFKGRDFELGELDLKYYDGKSEQKRCTIISGFPSGIGRRKLLTEYIIQKVSTNKTRTYEPICIELSESQSIEDLIFQLNDLFLQYSNDEILDIGNNSKEAKVLIACDLIKKAIYKKEVILIRDNGACVLSNGYLSEWFKNVITNNNLPNQLCIFVASKHSAKNNIERLFPQIMSFQLNPLTKNSTKVLFYAYAEITKISVKEDIAEYLFKNLSGVPSLIFRCADVLRDNVGSSNLLNLIKDVIKSEEKSYVAIINIIKNNTNHYQTLIMLSQFDFISFDIAYSILNKVIENPDDSLQFLYSYSLFERFGGQNQYIRVNSVVIDYINRERIKLNSEFKSAFEETIKSFIANGDAEKYDLSGYLYGIQMAIMSDIKGVDKKYLIPSFTLKAIIEEYKKTEYTHVITLCDRFLADSHNYFDEILRSIRYWLCSSLCRMQNDRFFHEIDFFNGYSKLFLLGFYHRWAKDYPKALEYYEEALSLSAGNKDKNYVAKAKHELVIIRLHLKDYAGALDLARENYESQKTNKYHIEAYFRCLIRSHKPDTKLLSSLLSEYNSLALDNKNKTIFDTLTSEFEFYIKNDFRNAYSNLRSIIEKASSDIRYYPYMALGEILSKKDMEIDSIFKKRYGNNPEIIDED